VRAPLLLVLASACGGSASEPPPPLRFVDCPETTCRETVTAPADQLAACYGWDATDGWPEVAPYGLDACAPTDGDCVIEVSNGATLLDDACGCASADDVDACCEAPRDPTPSAETLLLTLGAECGIVTSVRIVCDPPTQAPRLAGDCPVSR
jgi:hypothetical protein